MSRSCLFWDWTEDQLAVVLKEDDFLGIKLGNFKPDCPPLTEEELDEEGRQKLAVIRSVMTGELSDFFEGAAPFDFYTADKGGKITPPAENLRMIYSHCGLYGTVLDQDISTSFPDELLEKYQEAGVNAVWIQAVLYQLVPFPFDESYSAGWEARQARLRELVARVARYGIKVFLYLNEPRSMPLSFFEKYPELKGHERKELGDACLCTSCPEVLGYLREGVSSLCREVPGLGGFFLINMSENMTHCKSVAVKEFNCPRCGSIPAQKLVSDVITTIAEAAWSKDPNLQIVAWNWAWEVGMKEEEMRKCIAGIPSKVILQSTSETKIPTHIGGVDGEVRDYSMSIPGPGEWARNFWKIAKEYGHDICAKVQVNCTWECSTVPFLPVFDLIREHMTGLKAEGVEHLMLSWTLGGYPSVNLKVVNGCLADPSEAAYDRLLEEEYGENAPIIKKAASIFSEAYREFPFQIGCAYLGPQNGGPSNLLYLKPSGFQATMTCFAYDDLTKWRSIYPEEVYRNQWEKLTFRWKEGLELIRDLLDCDFKRMAYGGYGLFRSSCLQTAFVMERDGKADKEKLRKIVEEERELAEMMLRLMQQDASIGYEAANHYYFNKGMLAEKIISCDMLQKALLG